MSLGWLAFTADLVVIAVAGAPRGDHELAILRTEKTLKGEAPEVISVALKKDPDYPCDTSGAAPGERAVFFLERVGAAFRILASGRGKLRLSKDSQSVALRPPGDYSLTAALTTACADGSCPLAGLLKELSPYLQRREPTAFFHVTSGVPRGPGGVRADPELVSTQKSADVRCANAIPDLRGYLEGCTIGSSGDARAQLVPTADVWCTQGKTAGVFKCSEQRLRPAMESDPP